MWFYILAFLGGLLNTFWTIRALRRGYDIILWQRDERRTEPFSFWFYSTFCRGAAGLMLLVLPLLSVFGERNW